MGLATMFKKTFPSKKKKKHQRPFIQMEVGGPGRSYSITLQNLGVETVEEENPSTAEYSEIGSHMTAIHSSAEYSQIAGTPHDHPNNSEYSQRAASGSADYSEISATRSRNTVHLMRRDTTSTSMDSQTTNPIAVYSQVVKAGNKSADDETKCQGTSNSMLGKS